MPVDPLSLWEEFKVELCRDYMQPNKLSEPTPEMVNKVLLELQDIFAAAGIDMVKQFNLPCPTKPTGPAGKGEAKEIQVELDYSAQELAEEALFNYGSMNKEQKAVFLAIKHAVDHGKGGFFAINAPGGTGKTFVVKTILAYVRGKSQIALAMATSGIAAMVT